MFPCCHAPSLGNPTKASLINDAQEIDMERQQKCAAKHIGMLATQATQAIQAQTQHQTHLYQHLHQHQHINKRNESWRICLSVL